MDFDSFLRDFNTMLKDFLGNLIAFLPKLIFALLVFLAGYLIAKFVKFLIQRFIKGTNRFLSNQKIKKHIEQRHVDQFAAFAGKTVYWFIIILFVTLATEILGLPIITTWLSGIVQYLPNILAAIIIIFLGIIGGRIVGNIILSAINKSGIAYGSMLSRLVQYSIVLVTIIIAIDQLGVDIAFMASILEIILAALLFGAALSFGLGSKTAVNNIIGSYYVHNIYREGNVVKINNIEGKIIQITATNVILDTQDGQVSVPAKEFNENTSVLIRRDKNE